MTWHLGPMVAWDCETSGTDVENDRIVTTAYVEIDPGNPTLTRHHLIAVDVDIHPEAVKVHGISTERARAEGKPAAAVLDDVAGELAAMMSRGRPLVGFNVAFDLTMLDRELRRNGLPTLPERIGGPVAPVIDPHVIDRAVDKFRPGSRKLVDVARTYGVRADDISAHDAAGDALLAARVAYRIAQLAAAPASAVEARYADRRYPRELVAAFADLGRMSLAQLHAAQVGWRRQQMDSLRQYFDRRGETHDGCDGSWPMRPYAVQQEVTV